MENINIIIEERLQQTTDTSWNKTEKPFHRATPQMILEIAIRVDQSSAPITPADGDKYTSRIRAPCPSCPMHTLHLLVVNETQIDPMPLHLVHTESTHCATISFAVSLTS
jgi:hypothetical protein